MEWEHRGFGEEVSSRTQMPGELIFVLPGSCAMCSISVFSDFLLMACVCCLCLVICRERSVQAREHGVPVSPSCSGLSRMGHYRALTFAASGATWRGSALPAKECESEQLLCEGQLCLEQRRAGALPGLGRVFLQP